MADRPPKIVICSCEDTMPLDVDAVKRGCRGADVSIAHQLCRAELDKFRAAAAAGEPLIVGCTQEAPLFAEVAQERAGGGADIIYANIRETAGWSKDAAAAGPKMAALLAAAAEPVPEIPFVTLHQRRRDPDLRSRRAAIEAANLLKDHLDVTVLIKPPADVAPPRVTDFPVVKGLIRAAKGHLGAFELTVDSYAQPAPSSRGALAFATPRDGAVSNCDLVLDMSGGSAAVHRIRSARRLSARRSRRRRRRAQGGAQGARPRRHLRQAALRRLHRGSLRPFALEDRRLHALPRSLPDRRDRARRRSRRHRSPTSARVAGSAPRSARPARRPTHCRRRTC